RSKPSLRSRSDAAVKPTTLRHRTPPEGRPGSSTAASKRSRQRAPRPVAQFLQGENALHSFARRWKLPGGIMHDVFVFANLRLSVQIAFDAALHIRSVLERSAELFFLLHAMRTPPRPIHLHAAIGQTAGKRIVLVLGAVVEIVGEANRRHDEHHNDRDTLPLRAESLGPQSFLLPFSSLLRHGFLYHEQRRGLQRLKPPPVAPMAARRSPGTPESAPRRPPSRPPVRRGETPPAELPVAPPADAECGCHHKASPNSGSAPIAQSVPTAHTRSIHHR